MWYVISTIVPSCSLHAACIIIKALLFYRNLVCFACYYDVYRYWNYSLINVDSVLEFVINSTFFSHSANGDRDP
jgi:hypothetical protein